MLSTMKLHALGIANFFLLQWLTMRLCFVYDELDGGELKYKHWMVIHGVMPLTGWWSRYKYVWGNK